MCESSWRRVIRGCHPAVAGIRQVRSRSSTSASSSSSPRATSRSAQSAATGFEIDPARKRVSGVTGSPLSASRTPAAPVQASSPSRISATLTPGTPKRFSQSESGASAHGSEAGGSGMRTSPITSSMDGSPVTTASIPGPSEHPGQPVGDQRPGHRQGHVQAGVGGHAATLVPEQHDRASIRGRERGEPRRAFGDPDG